MIMTDNNQNQLLTIFTQAGNESCKLKIDDDEDSPMEKYDLFSSSDENLYEDTSDESLTFNDLDFLLEISGSDASQDYGLLRNEENSIIDPMEIKLNKNIKMPTAYERLTVFQKFQENRKVEKITEKEHRAITSKIRAEKAKTKTVQILEWYLMSKLAENRHHIYEVARLKYDRSVDLAKKEIEAEKMNILDQMNKNLQNVLEEEHKKQYAMKKKLFEEEIFQAAESIENDLRDKYENYLLKLKLSDLKDNYQQDMNEYCVFWKKKVHDIYRKLEEHKLETSKNLSFYENQRAVECMLNTESEWRKKAKESFDENVELIENVVSMVPPKESELKSLRKHNKKLESRIGQWENIMPDVLQQMESFVKFVFESTPERENFLKTINELKAFKDILPEPMATPLKKSVSEMFDDGRSESHQKERYSGQTNLRKRDLDHTRRQLLRMKETLLEALTIQSFQLRQSRRRSSKQRLSKASVTSRLTEIINLAESIFQVKGSKYSVPDMQNPQNFVEKRTLSLENILFESTKKPLYKLKCT